MENPYVVQAGVGAYESISGGGVPGPPPSTSQSSNYGYLILVISFVNANVY